ncbi:MAG: glycosyltransferase family 4 protein [Erysipelotrichaceae bacterium]|nr:glycosyltransferase family 4 protein [Erysipelotrichaceae bacterium]
MKKIICYIDSMQLGGAQRVMANLTKHFVNSKIDVLLVNDIVPVEKIPEYEIDKKVRRIYLDFGRVETKGIRKNIHRITVLRKIIKSEKPDVVLSFIGPPNIRMLIATIGLKTRKIVSVRNDPYKEYGTGKMRIIVNFLFGLANGCVFQTDDAANYFSNKLRKRSIVIYNPVNQVFYNTKHHSDEKTIIMVGRLNHQKNYSMAINAFSLIANKYPELILSIFGEGELRNNLQKQIDKHGLKGRILLNGRTNNVEEKLSSAMIFVMTSDYEGMPNALMEAMAMGIPCISTDCPCGGARMIIKHGQSGFLIDCNNEVQLAEKIEILVSNEKIRKLMSCKAKASAQDFFPDKIYKEWDKFLF